MFREGSVKAIRTLVDVTRCELIADATLVLGLKSSDVIWDVEPGQFVMLGPLIDELYEPFLNRPFSIHRCPGDGTMELLIGVVGRATRMIERKGEGSSIWLMGPLGKGFRAPKNARRAVLVAGGLGVAPMFCLAENLRRQGKQVCLLYGAKSHASLVPTGELTKIGVDVELATDDGSGGFQGVVSDLFFEKMTKLSATELRDTYLAACGPMAMLEAVNKKRLRFALSLEASLESRMACGLGACLGCSQTLVAGRIGRVCCDGPVFDAEEVFEK